MVSEHTGCVKRASSESCKLAVEPYSATHTCHGKLGSLKPILQEFVESEGRKWYRSECCVAARKGISYANYRRSALVHANLSVFFDCRWMVSFNLERSLLKLKVLVTSYLRQLRRFPRSVEIS
jgi:hypothetical protein